MPVEIVINSQKYFNQYNNGLTFSTNLTDYTDNFVGSVMEKISVDLEIDVYSYYEAGTSNPVTYEDLGSSNFKLKKNAGNWSDDGFAIGDSVKVQTSVYPVGGVLGTVYNVNQNYLWITFASAFSGTVNKVINLTQPTAVIYSPNLIENEETFNILSKVSGNDSSYYLAGITTSFQTMAGLGPYNDFVSGDVKIKYVSNPSDGHYVYNITHELVVAPYYLEGWEDFLNGINMPSIYSGLASLKYVFECDFRTVLSNPNTSKKGNFFVQLGSTGWFDENFNGFDNKYTINSIAYEDSATADSADGVIVGSLTKVTVLINKNTGVFDAADRVGAYISYLPGATEYTATATDIQSNFMLDNRVVDADGVSVVGTGVIKSIEANVLNPTTMQLIFETEYTTAQILRLSETSEYIIGVGISEDGLTSGNSDRVVLLADYNTYDLNADISGLMGVSDLKLQLYDDVYATVEDWTSLYVWNEDGIRARFQFWLDTNFSAVINSLDFVLLAYNAVTEDYFELDKYSFGVSNSIISGGIQQLIFDELRGYNLSTDTEPNYFNEASIALGSNVAGKQYYDLAIGQKMSWQDWISNLNVPTAFYDATATQNNRNLKASNYAGPLGYSIRLALKANLSGEDANGQSGLTDYLFISPTITVFDYDESADWSATIETFHPTTLVNLGGAVLNGEDTLFRTTFTQLSGAVTSLANTFVEHGIQDTGDNGYNTDISTNLFDEPTTNKLGSISFSIVAGKIESECTIDGSLIDGPQDLTAKIIKTVPIVAGGKLMEDGTTKTDESGTTKVIE